MDEEKKVEPHGNITLTNHETRIDNSTVICLENETYIDNDDAKSCKFKKSRPLLDCKVEDIENDIADIFGDENQEDHRMVNMPLFEEKLEVFDCDDCQKR